MATNRLSYEGVKPQRGSWKEKLLLFFQNNPEEWLSAPDAAVKFSVTFHKAKFFMDWAHEVKLLLKEGDCYFAALRLIKNLEPKPTKPASFIDQIELEDNIPLPRLKAAKPAEGWEALLLRMTTGQSFEITENRRGPVQRQAALLKRRGEGTYSQRHDKSAGTIRVWRVA